MKKIVLILFGCFFLISGKIVYSIGTDYFRGGQYDSDEGLAIDLSIFDAAEEADPEDDPEQATERGWGENPFRCLEPVSGDPATEQAEAGQAGAEGFKLQAVSFGGGRAFAVINGEPLAPGEMISGFEVREITMERVVLCKGEETIVLKLMD